ncbi:MAG: DMT family transporter [Pseudomonadota bacterium]
MNFNALLVFAAIGAGVMIPLQGVINGRLATYIGGPVQAALVSFGVGLAALIAINIAIGSRVPNASAFDGAPFWIWFGGFLGVVMVVLAATAVPRIGVATYVSAIIAGQLTAAIAYDHFGVLGQTVREATPLRLLGVVFLVIGVILIRRF